MIATLLGASIGVPYAVSHKTAPPAATGASAPNAASHSGWSWPTWISPASPPTGTMATTPTAPTQTGPAQLSQAPPVDRVRMHPVEQVLRFDLTRDWVYRNWDRKSTGPTDVGLFAVRVALVSGTDISSLAGSLTYFFNAQGQIEHISFRGRTGDSTRLVDFLTRTYGFQRAASPTGEQVFQVGQSGKVQSELRTHPESVLLSTLPHGSIAVELELARPGSKRYLPPRGPVLQIPQVASTAPPASKAAQTAEGADAATASDGTSLFDKARYATPQEQEQVLWRRWPN